MFKTNFLSDTAALDLSRKHGTPIFVYSKKALLKQAKEMLSIPAPNGLVIRYAMKANPHPDILKIMRGAGVLIDASSNYEIYHAIAAGFKPDEILLTSQQLAPDLKELVEKGVEFNATSLRQLENYGKLFKKSKISVRINPGIGSGHSVKTNVGGHTSSFGIWHEYIPEVLAMAKKYELTIHRMHTQIGSGGDPLIWQEAARVSLELIKNFPDAEIINLGGGFKVARMDNEQGADIAVVGQTLADELSHFQKNTGRKLKLELEPGTFIAANSGILISRIDDIVDTGDEGYKFIKLDTGMNDILRPSLYGSQQPIAVIGDHKEEEDYVVVGHNCESGDLLTPAPSDTEVVMPRTLKKAEIGDLVLIGGTGAYCASMAAHGYNSYPDAREIVI